MPPVKALEMGVLYFETGGMKSKPHQKQSSYRHIFSVLLHTSQTSRSGWLDRLGTAMGSCVCSFNVQQRGRTKQHQGLNKVKEYSVSVTCFPQPYPHKRRFVQCLRFKKIVSRAECMDDITVHIY